MGQSYLQLVGKPPVCTSLAFREWYLALIAARVAEIPLVRGLTFYVDQTNGNDGNPGTLASPWKTIAKVNSYITNTWTGTATGVRFRLKRGCTWRETGVTLTLNKPYITVDDYGNSYDPPPILSAFSAIYPASGWTLTAGQTYTYERSELNDVAWFREATRGNVYTLRSSIAEVEANPASFWWDPSVSKLYVHNRRNTTLADGGAGYAIVVSNQTCGVLVTADNVRVENIVSEGYGCHRTTPHNQQYCFMVQPALATNACLFVGCEGYYGGTHIAGMNGNFGYSTWVNCTWGLVFYGGNAWVAYGASGGHEAVAYNTHFPYGCLPTTAHTAQAGVGYHAHTSGAPNKVGLFLMVGSRFPAGEFQYGAATGSGGIADQIAWADLADCRNWVVDEVFEARTWKPADNNITNETTIGGAVGGDYNVRINCTVQAQCLKANPSGYTGITSFMGGVHINATYDINWINDSTTQRDQFTYQGLTYGAASNTAEFYNSLIRHRSNVKMVPGYCVESMSGAGTPAAVFKNCIFDASIAYTDNNYIPSLARVGANNTAATLVNNAYIALDRDATGTRGYDQDPYRVPLCGVPGIMTPTASSPLVSANQQTVRGYRLEYDADWQERNSVTCIGPREIPSPGVISTSTGVFQKS